MNYHYLGEEINEYENLSKYNKTSNLLYIDERTMLKKIKDIEDFTKLVTIKDKLMHINFKLAWLKIH